MSSRNMQSKTNQSCVNQLLMKFGGVVLFFVHSIFSVLFHLTNYLLYCIHSLKSLYYRTNTYRHISVSLLKEELKCYPKVPKHLAVIIEEEDISYQDCVKLILWCIHSGIPYISFYNHSNGKS